MRRFVSRRGCPDTLYSDNGSNFVGDQAEIKTLQHLLLSEHVNSLQAIAAELQLKWSFNPSRAPHFEGLWDAAVKSAKKHLRRTMDNNVHNFEELSTLFCQIENMLNSRPTGTISEDPKEETPITHADLCSGGKMDLIPSQSSNTTSNKEDCSPMKRWAFTQNLLHGFWTRWSKDYCLLFKNGETGHRRRKIINSGILYILQMTINCLCIGP